MFAGVHVDGDDAAERRFQERQPAWTRQPRLCEADEIVGALPRFRFLNLDQRRNAVGTDIKQSRLGIHRGARPTRAAGIAGNLDSAALRWRGVKAAAIEGTGDLDRLLVYLRREIDQILVARALQVEGGRLRRN